MMSKNIPTAVSMWWNFVTSAKKYKDVSLIFSLIIYVICELFITVVK